MANLFYWYTSRVSFTTTRTALVLIGGFLWRWCGFEWALWTMAALDFTLLLIVLIGFSLCDKDEWNALKNSGELNTTVALSQAVISIIMWVTMAQQGHTFMAAALALVTIMAVSTVVKGLSK